MKIDKSAKLIYGPRTPGAVINGVTLDTTDGVAHSGHGFACVGYEVGAAPLTGEAKRKGGSRVYVKLTVNRGDIKFFPVRDDSGEVVGFEVAASGDDASIALTAALAEIVDRLKMDL